MSIDKLELWRRGDKITASKLNDALQAVNCLIELENERLEETASSSNESSGVQYNSVSLQDNVPSWYQDVTPLWNQDGETVIYDSWDNLGEKVTPEAGLYGRDTGVNTLTATAYNDNATLKLVKGEKEIKAGQQVVQVITVNKGGSICNNEIQIYDSISDIPSAIINPDGVSKIYRRLSRIISDDSNGSVESMPEPSAAWLYKSVATNDFTLSPITVNAVAATNKKDPDKGDNQSGDNQSGGQQQGGDNNQGGGESEESQPDAVKEQIAQMLVCGGIFHKVKGVENKGGLAFCDSSTKVGLQSGVEFYSAPLVVCGAGYLPATFSCVSKSITPKGKAITVAEFPVINKIYEWCNNSKSYVQKNADDTKKLILRAQPVSCNAWQWGFTYDGQVDVDTYRYLPPEEQPSVTVSGGEGVSVTKQANNYEVSRNLFLEAMASTEQHPCGDGQVAVDTNAITIYCCKKDNKITYKLYAPKAAPCAYTFDPTYFTVTDNQVSLNTTALYDIAVEVANEIEVEVTACGIVDTISSGKIKTTTQGLSLNGTQYSATTRASVVSC